MDASRRRKLAAALAAMVQYRAEFEQPQAGAPPAPAGPAPCAARPGAWADAGRQHGMLMRDFWQRRLAKSW